MTDPERRMNEEAATILDELAAELRSGRAAAVAIEHHRHVVAHRLRGESVEVTLHSAADVARADALKRLRAVPAEDLARAIARVRYEQTTSAPNELVRVAASRASDAEGEAVRTVLLAALD